MKKKILPDQTPSTADQSTKDGVASLAKKAFNRRSFMRNSVLAGAVMTGASVLDAVPSALAEPGNGHLTRGDAAILSFLAAAEIIESDLWLQYAELGGVQMFNNHLDDELFKIASQQIQGYPSTNPGNIGNAAYTSALIPLDTDMPQYIHDNTEDEFSHQFFINAYLMSKGHPPVSLEQFRIIEGSKATGAVQGVKRLTNLTQLKVDTTWWTRYRSRTGNPDLGDSFPNAVPSLATNPFPAIPRTDADTDTSTQAGANFLQAIANTAGFHFAFIEQGGSSLYPSLAQRVSNVEVLRILLSIGPTETSHFQTWHDKAGNAPAISATDPVTGVSVSFPDLTAPTLDTEGLTDDQVEDLQSNLIMPEPTFFLSKTKFPPISIIRPTETRNVAQGAILGLIQDGLFNGQSQDFLNHVMGLAKAADDARRGTF